MCFPCATGVLCMFRSCGQGHTVNSYKPTTTNTPPPPKKKEKKYKQVRKQKNTSTFDPPPPPRPNTPQPTHINARARQRSFTLLHINMTEKWSYCVTVLKGLLNGYCHHIVAVKYTARLLICFGLRDFFNVSVKRIASKRWRLQTVGG